VPPNGCVKDDSPVRFGTTEDAERDHFKTTQQFAAWTFTLAGKVPGQPS